MFDRPVPIRRTLATATVITTVLLAQFQVARAQVNILTQHNDNLRDGVNAGETALTPANVNKTQFGLLFKIPVDDQVFAQPLVVAKVNIAGGTHSVVYVATANNSVYAFDANTGTQYWHVNFGAPMSMAIAKWDCQDVLGSSGIMSTPVIANNSLYVVAQTYVNSTSIHRLHSLNLSTGAEQANSPVQIQGSDFNSYDELQRPALLAANGNVYFSFAGHCDQGSWKGLTFAYSQSSLAQVGVFDAAPNVNGNGIWQSGNGAAADAAGNIYWVTGNGMGSDGWDGVEDFSETLLKASPTLGLEDWHTPTNWSSLDGGDADLTASGPVLLSNTNLMVAGGKDGNLRLVNTGNMGHLGDSTAVQNWLVTSSHIHSLNYFNSNLYVWGQSDYLKVFKFGGTTFGTTPTYTGSIRAVGHPGASLSISSAGTANGILWAATNSQGKSDGSGAWHMSEPGILYAYNLANMSQLWTSEQNASRDDCNYYAKFTDPTIANGKVYLPSFGNAQTQSGQVCVYGELTGGSTAPSGTFLIPNGTYYVTSALDGQAIDDPGFSGTAGTGLEQWTLNKGTNQQWTVTNLGNNVVTLTNVASGQALEVRGGSNAASALVDQNLNQGSLWQQWTVSSPGGTAVELANKVTGQSLDIDGASKTAGASLDQYPYHSVSWELWNFTPVN